MLVVVTNGWQSESTDGPKDDWSRNFWSGCNGFRGYLTTTLARTATTPRLYVDYYLSEFSFKFVFIFRR